MTIRNNCASNIVVSLSDFPSTTTKIRRNESRRSTNKYLEGIMRSGASWRALNNLWKLLNRQISGRASRILPSLKCTCKEAERILREGRQRVYENPIKATPI